MKVEETRSAEQKLSIFWWVYILDKGLSLRLGRYSNFQDRDIDVTATLIPDSRADPIGFRQYFYLTVSCARVQGKAYDQLYSAGSLSISPHDREARVNELVEELSLLHGELHQSRVMFLCVA